MKILWYGVAPWAPTGYGQQTANFTPRIRDHGHDVAISAYYGLYGAAMPWNGITVYPGDDWTDTHKFRLLDSQVADHGDGEEVQVITLVDVWTLKREPLSKHRVACWVPIDHDPCPAEVKEFFDETDATPIAMSRFGERAMRDRGLDPLYVPHGIDTNVFKPHDQGEMRDLFGFPRDAFLVGMVANNQGNLPPRKAFPQAIEAFARFREKRSDAFLYLHCEMAGLRAGVNLPELCDTFGIPPSAVGFAPQERLEFGIPQAALAAVYSTMDVHLLPSYGEGFGIPIVEAQACGVPVIVSDWTAMPELVGAGWKVGGERWWNNSHKSWWLSASVPAIVDALEQAYDGAAGMRGQAREFAVAYDADRVLEEFWVPALEALDAPREVPALVPANRATRRAAARAKVAV